jgi:hypothetical protein
MDTNIIVPTTTALPQAREAINITAPNMRILVATLIGTAPLVTARFAAKAMAQMMEKQKAGSVAGKGKKRAAKDFDEAFEGAKHIAEEGWCGVHAGAFRNALISACRLVGFKMTIAKLSLFVVADGYEALDNTPLVRIIGPDPKRTDMPVRNATGVIDIRTRPMWPEWSMRLRVRYDADQFSAADVTNLLSRVGEQVGIGEGRADSKSSAGVGWGHFRVVAETDMEATP